MVNLAAKTRIKMTEIIAINIVKILTLGSLSFLFALVLTPPLTHFLYKNRLWRKEVRTKSIDGKEIPFFKKFHSEGETNIPRFGGILIWITPLFLAFLFLILSKTARRLFKN